MSLENCGTLYNQMLFICAEWGLCMQAFWDPMQCCLQPPCASLLLGNLYICIESWKKWHIIQSKLIVFLKRGDCACRHSGRPCSSVCNLLVHHHCGPDWRHWCLHPVVHILSKLRSFLFNHASTRCNCVVCLQAVVLLDVSGFAESEMTFISCLFAGSDWNHWHEYLLGGTARQGKHAWDFAQ